MTYPPEPRWQHIPRSPLTEAQRALAASQADLTRVAEERDEARARAERFGGYWRECSRHRDQLAAEHAEAVAAYEATLLSVRAELASARQELARLRALCATEPGTDPLSATTDSPPIPAGDRKETE